MHVGWTTFLDGCWVIDFRGGEGRNWAEAPVSTSCGGLTCHDDDDAHIPPPSSPLLLLVAENVPIPSWGSKKFIIKGFVSVEK